MLKKRYSLCVFLFLCAGVCFANSDLDLSLHPKKLQESIEKCNILAQSTPECEHLHKMAVRVNSLAYELRMNPQAYGQKILSLQVAIAKQIDKPQSSANTQSEIHPTLEQELRERLAIIKWLESPER